MNTSFVRHVSTAESVVGGRASVTFTEGRSKPLNVALAPGGVHGWIPSRGTTLRVAEGSLWVTQDGDARDLVLAQGDCLQIEHRGRVVAQSLSGPAQLQVFSD